MPERRINTPIPSFSAGWTDWAPTPVYYDVGGLVCAAPTNSVTVTGRIRQFPGLMEYEVWLTWIMLAVDPVTYISVAIPVASALPVMDYFKSTGGQVNIAPYPPYIPTMYSAQALGSYLDTLNGVITSESFSSYNLAVGSIHMQGYYPVVIP